jgi:mannose-6-phosphate isomerase-like protein (cupin superfamily)
MYLTLEPNQRRTTMIFIEQSAAPVFDIPGLRVVGLAAPSRGAAETCVWRLTMAPGTPATPHSIDREEIFVGLSGRARMEVGGEERLLAPGDAVVIPAGQSFSLSNPGAEPFTALAVLPVGGRALLPGGQPFAPPWTL